MVKIISPNQKTIDCVKSNNFDKHQQITNTCNMVERFVQSISQINDSASFDTSFEVKPIEATEQQRIFRHRCVTELDRESLARFVRDFEARQQANKLPQRSNSSVNATPKSSPYLCRKMKSIYESVRSAGSSSPQSSRSASPKPANDVQSLHSDLGSFDSQHEHDVEAHEDLQRAQPARGSYRSAVKVLQFLSGKKKCRAKKQQQQQQNHTNEYASLPVELQFGCQPLPDSDAEHYDGEEEHDDGISSAGSNFTQHSSERSRHGTPDSSFEMHAPLLPTFKVTPPQAAKCGMGAAYEFARFLRSSLRVKRASVNKLRRSVSDPDTFQQMDFTKAPPQQQKEPPQQENVSDDAQQRYAFRDSTNVIRTMS